MSSSVAVWLVEGTRKKTRMNARALKPLFGGWGVSLGFGEEVGRKEGEWGAWDLDAKERGCLRE